MTRCGSTAATCCAPGNAYPVSDSPRWNACIDLDPSGDLLATWIAKEELRALHACAGTAARHTIRARLFDFYTWCADTDVPEVHTLAALIDTWWPAVLTFPQTGATNAATEGTNRPIKSGTALCPGCGHLSARVHRRYQRRLADAAVGGRRVEIVLRVRLFVCQDRRCPGAPVR